MTRQTICTALISLALMLVGPSSALSCIEMEVSPDDVEETLKKAQDKLEGIERLQRERLEKLPPEERARVVEAAEARRQKDEEERLAGYPKAKEARKKADEARKKAEAELRSVNERNGWYVEVAALDNTCKPQCTGPEREASKRLWQRLENRLQQELKDGSSLEILKEKIENGQWLAETERQQFRATVHNHRLDGFCEGLGYPG